MLSLLLPPPRRLCFQRRLFVCSFVSRVTQKLPIFTKFDGKVANGPWKKPLYFGGNPDNITLGL